MENGGQHFGCNLIHVRNHEQQALGSRVGACHSTGSQGTMDSTSGAAFGLHFAHLNGSTEDVLATLSRPDVHHVCHRAGRCNRINTGNFGKRIAYMRCGGITVHGLEFSFGHKNPLMLIVLLPLAWEAAN